MSENNFTPDPYFLKLIEATKQGQDITNILPEEVEDPTPKGIRSLIDFVIDELDELEVDSRLDNCNECSD